MITYCIAVWGEFTKFIGGRGGLAHWLMFGAALLCCILMGKSTRKKLFWPSALVLVFFFNPLFYAYVGTRFLSGVYWRLLWMLPVSFVIAFVLTELTFKVKKNIFRAAAVIAACACIVLTGRREFSAETYSEKENAYEIPQAAIEISDIVMGQLWDWKESIIVPNELMCYIRQYTCAVTPLYGRNAEGFITNIEPAEASVFAEMSREEPDVELITDVAKEKGCRFIVFNTSFHRIPEDLTGYGYEQIDVVEDVYVIYRQIGQPD